MSDGEKYREFARRIVNETRKFDSNSSVRRSRAARDTKKLDGWDALDAAACKRFVLKITKMIEGF